MAAKRKLWLNLTELRDRLIWHCSSLFGKDDFAVIRPVRRYLSLFMYESMGNPAKGGGDGRGGGDKCRA